MDGIIIINKTKGCTSHDIVYKIKKMLNEKVGHTGTLDPMAEGVLPILIGKGTLASKYLINHDKKYIVELQLGTKTDTADGEGRIVKQQPVNKEIYIGAKNRVKNLKEYAKDNNIEADLFLGIESGINDLLGRWMITNIAVIEDNDDFESYGTSPSFPVPDNLVQKVLDTNLSEAMDTVLGEDKERHNHSGGIQLLTHNKISRIDLTEDAFIMALTKYINGEKWR